MESILPKKEEERQLDSVSVKIEEVQEQIPVKMDPVDIKRECAAPAALLGRPTAPRLTKRRRRRQVLRDSMESITKNDIRRLARRAGVKRMSNSPEMIHWAKVYLKCFLEPVIADTIKFTEHARRRTVTALDVVHALKLRGRTLYGYGG